MSTKLKQDMLSKHDQEVLNSIFDPLQITADSMKIISEDDVGNCVDFEEKKTEAEKLSKGLEVEAVKLAEQGKLDDALAAFAKALEIAPGRASILNNRAQVLRLAGRDDDAFEDLNNAISLASKQPRTRCHALCQRGVLNRKRENLDAAREDFEAAAKLGSNFAKSQLVEINPFAALCNQMLRQTFEQLEQMK